MQAHRQGGGEGDLTGFTQISFGNNPKITGL